MQLDLFTFSGRMSPEFSARTTMLSVRSWRALSDLMKLSYRSTDGRTQAWYLAPKDQRRGAYWMPNTSAFPNGARVCSLSSVLVNPDDIPRTYFLSGRACAGIIRRAAKRGKELPRALMLALQQGADSVRSTI